MPIEIEKKKLTFKYEKPKILTIAEVENKTATQLIYYLAKLSGNRKDKKYRINKSIAKDELKKAIKVEPI